MSMEQRITTLEEVSQLGIAALRQSNEAMQRYEASSALRDEAMLQLASALERAEESARDLAEAASRREDAMQALLAFVPITQAEILRLDSRIDAIDKLRGCVTISISHRERVRVRASPVCHQ